MGFEDLSHTPDFELPPNAPDAPADLVSLIEECIEGLHKAQIHKMVRSGQYESIATVLCQENPSKKTRPTATADDISDYCMMTMQYEIDKTDDPGTYRVTLIGPPGRGRFQRSKHVELGDADQGARSKRMMSEPELCQQQGEYIGELHSQIVAMSETVHSMIKPLLQENKEMMKIVSDASKKQAEIRREELRHELELKMHNDTIKLEESKEEIKSERWKETMEVIKESGAVEGFMKVLMKKMDSGDADQEDDDDSGEGEEPEAEDGSGENDEESKSDGDLGENDKSKLEKAKSVKDKPSRKSSKVLDEKTVDAISSGKAMTEEQISEVFKKSGMAKADENPLAVMTEVLKMMIDEKEQWPVIQETLSQEQFVVFKKILNSQKDTVIERNLKKLYQMKGARRLLKLEEHLDEEQRKYVDKLMEIAMKK